jgi:hypothetical protein
LFLPANKNLETRSTQRKLVAEEAEKVSDPVLCDLCVLILRELKILLTYVKIAVPLC